VAGPEQAGLADEVARRTWYHTLELPGGTVTPGLFDHRPVLARYKLPTDLTGKRVLDVGTFDGLFAFEFERRGASVASIDVPDVEQMDWPVPLRRKGLPEREQQRTNFDVVREVLGSSVQRHLVSVYDVTREQIGGFDLVFVGSLLLHLRDPIGALMALHGVTDGEIIIAEEVDRRLDLLHPRTPHARLQSSSPYMTWWIPNTAALTEYLSAAGFVDIRRGETFTVPFRAQRGGVRHTVLHARPGP
jgi:tRNA (mo5U34)-methyltransferase